MAKQLRDAAAASCAWAEEVLEASVRRRSEPADRSPEMTEWIENTTIRLEIARSRREMHRADLEMIRRARAEERETAELEQWVRSRTASMLEQGWTPEECAGFGMDARDIAGPRPVDHGAR